MTWNEAYELIDVYTDKSGTAYFNIPEKKILLKEGLYSYLETISNNFESDLISTDGIYTLIEGPQAITVTGNQGALPSEFMYRLNCYAGVPENEVRYIKWNNWSHTNDDPHNKPEGGIPIFTLKSTGMHLEGLAVGTPTIYLVYIKKPQFAVADGSGEWVNLPEQEQRKVIKYAFRMATSHMDDAQRFQMITAMSEDNRT